MSRWHQFKQFIGAESNPVSYREGLISLIGGIICVAAMFAVSSYYVHSAALVPIVASMGASIALLFAVPHGPMSQPWPLLGGHIVSAIAGVTCAMLVANHIAAAALAVGLAIGAMYYLRCFHPPGGATALIAVIGGPAVSALGYQYVLTPIAANAAVVFLVAILFNYIFPWRRYPAYLYRLGRPPHETGLAPIKHEDFVYALSQMDTFVDVTEEDLLRIYALATRRKT